MLGGDQIRNLGGSGGMLPREENLKIGDEIMHSRQLFSIQYGKIA